MGFIATGRRCCVALVLTLAACISCSTQNVGTSSGVSTTQNFVGRLTTAGSSETPLVAFIVAPKDDGSLDVRAYLCDGVEGGDLLWVRGPATSKAPSGLASGPYAFNLTSAQGLQVTGEITPNGITGTVTRKAASAIGTEPEPFVAARATEGSGIFDLTVDEAGNVAGASLTGDTLTLSKTSEPAITVGDGTALTGVLATVDGQQFEVAQVDLSLLTPDELGGEGFDAQLAAGEKGVAVGTFRAIVLLNGSGFTTFGRLLLPGTGVNNVPPQFGSRRVAFSSRFTGGRP